MSDLRKAAEMALEALEMTRVVFKVDDRDYGLSRVSNAAEALRQALAKPEQRGHCTCGDPTALGYVHFRTRPCIYYTAPSKREWVGLTDEEINLIYAQPQTHAGQYARAIEAKLKEKNI